MTRSTPLREATTRGAELDAPRAGAGNEQSPHFRHDLHHVSSPAQLLIVFCSLIALTGVTVWASNLAVGDFEVWIALGIAGCKAILVAAFFMHLRYDQPTNAALLAMSVLVVVLFLGLTLSDTLQLMPEVEAADVQSSRMSLGPG